MKPPCIDGNDVSSRIYGLAMALFGMRRFLLEVLSNPMRPKGLRTPPSAWRAPNDFNRIAKLTELIALLGEPGDAGWV